MASEQKNVDCIRDCDHLQSTPLFSARPFGARAANVPGVRRHRCRRRKPPACRSCSRRIGRNPALQGPACLASRPRISKVLDFKQGAAPGGGRVCCFPRRRLHNTVLVSRGSRSRRPARSVRYRWKGFIGKKAQRSRYPIPRSIRVFRPHLLGPPGKCGQASKSSRGSHSARAHVTQPERAPTAGLARRKLLDLRGAPFRSRRLRRTLHLRV